MGLDPHGFTHCWTLFSKFFSSFPRGTCSLSVLRPYSLSLGWSLPPVLGCNPKQPDSRTATRRAAAVASCTGLSPSPTLPSKRLGRDGLEDHRTGPLLRSTSRTTRNAISTVGHFPLHSPLLRESWLVFRPPLSDMLKFGGSSWPSQGPHTFVRAFLLRTMGSFLHFGGRGRGLFRRIGGKDGRRAATAPTHRTCVSVQRGNGLSTGHARRSKRRAPFAFKASTLRSAIHTTFLAVGCVLHGCASPEIHRAEHNSLFDLQSRRGLFGVNKRTTIRVDDDRWWSFRRFTYGNLVTIFTSSKWSSSTDSTGPCRDLTNAAGSIRKASLNHSIGSSDGGCVQRAGT